MDIENNVDEEETRRHKFWKYLFMTWMRFMIDIVIGHVTSTANTLSELPSTVLGMF